MKNILTIIPARSGSKGIKNKNLKILNGKPLINYSIEIAKKLKKISDICISTDSREIKNIVMNYSIDFYGLRPKYLSGDSSLTVDVVKYELKKYEKILKKKYEYILLLQPTCPIRKIEHLKNIINTVMSKKNDYDSGISLRKIEADHPCRMKVLKNKKLRNLIGGTSEDMRPRQKLPPVYIRSGSYYFIKVSEMKKNNSLVGKKCYGLVLKALYTYNIDTIDDLNLLKMKINK